MPQSIFEVSAVSSADHLILTIASTSNEVFNEKMFFVELTFDLSGLPWLSRTVFQTRNSILDFSGEILL
jgi:hypothetical protein